MGRLLINYHIRNNIALQAVNIKGPKSIRFRHSVCFCETVRLKKKHTHISEAKAGKGNRANTGKPEQEPRKHAQAGAGIVLTHASQSRNRMNMREPEQESCKHTQAGAGTCTSRDSCSFMECQSPRFQFGFVASVSNKLGLGLGLPLMILMHWFKGGFEP